MTESVSAELGKTQDIKTDILCALRLVCLYLGMSKKTFLEPNASVSEVLKASCGSIFIYI